MKRLQTILGWDWDDFMLGIFMGIVTLAFVGAMAFGVLCGYQEYQGVYHNRAVELKLLDNSIREHETQAANHRTHCTHSAVRDVCQTAHAMWLDYLNFEREEPLERLRKR